MDNIQLEAGAIEDGVVKCYSAMHEYGFITRKKGKDVFFLRSSFANEDQIEEGARVQFVVVADKKGPRAQAISRVM